MFHALQTLVKIVRLLRPRLRLIATAAVLAIPVATHALDFEVSYTDNRPLFPPALWIEMTGEVISGDTQRFLASISPYLGKEIYEVVISLDSPGGNLVESLRLGRAVSELPYLTRAFVGVDGGSKVCASACVNVYLGANFRFLTDDARIGVHRFSMVGDSLASDEAISISQELSAEILAYIRDMRADPSFFNVIVSAHAEEIYWVPRETLEALRVVTNGIYSETAEYRNVNGSIALYLEQVGMFGTNALTLMCGDKGLIGIFDLNEPELTTFHELELYVDGRTFNVPDYEILDRKNYRLKAVALIPHNILQLLASSEEVGARMSSISADIFFGFEEGIADSKVAETARGCLISTPVAKMNTVIGVDVMGGDLTQNGYRNVTFDQCQRICLENNQCVAVSYVIEKNWCWPKGSVPATLANPSIASAVKE